MCLSRIKRILKKTSRSYFGYKVVIGHKMVVGHSLKDFYTPTVYNVWIEYWKLDTWYLPSYKNVHNYIDYKGGIHSTRNLEDLDKFFYNQPQHTPVIAITHTDKYYECGFHFFDKIYDAYKYTNLSDIKFNNHLLVFCEFKERLSMGYQGTLYCGVARRMRILDEIPWEEAALEFKQASLKGIMP